MRDQQTAVVHGRIRGIFVDRLPLPAAGVESKRHRRRLRGLAVIPDAVIVVWIVGPAGEVDPAVPIGGTGCNPVTSRSRMLGQLRPFNLGDVASRDLSHPALARRYVLRTG